MPAAQVPPPTKEIFAPALGGTERYDYNYGTGFRINADDEAAHFNFRIPHDFHSVISVELVWWALAVVTGMALNVETQAGAAGENYATHLDSTTISQNTAAFIIYASDISAALDLIAAGDYVGIKVSRGTGGNFNGVILGVRLRYT